MLNLGKLLGREYDTGQLSHTYDLGAPKVF